MLRRQDGRVLKPVVKPLLGEREIAFYESLQASEDPVMLQLKNCVPRYYGTTELPIFGRRKISRTSIFRLGSILFCVSLFSCSSTYMCYCIQKITLCELSLLSICVVLYRVIHKNGILNCVLRQEYAIVIKLNVFVGNMR